MKSSLIRYITFLIAAFSLISAFFSVIAIEQRWIVYTTFGCLGVIMLISAFFFFRGREFEPGGEGSSPAEPAFSPSECELRNPKNEAELKEIWRISQSIYGDMNVEFDKVVSWWKCYQKGVYVLYQGFTIIGYLSSWPLKKQAFDDILAGKRRERAITAKSICDENWVKPKTYWYVSNIVIRRKYRRTAALRTLILKASQGWIREVDFHNGVKLCALAYSKEGEALLKRLGFSKFKDAKETLDKLPVYLSTPTQGDFQRTLERVVSKPRA
ncbi:MAG TPA: hypothetical protein VF546_06805 [Pyrinomonadaceae bacterium]|jgi:hypothetical protein